MILDSDERINSKCYCELILGEAGFDIVKKTYDKRDIALWLDDGAKYHTSKTTTAYRKSMGIERMDWPAQSPDLNPIENIWHLMKMRILKQRHRITTKEEMKRVLLEEWNKIPLKYIRKLISDMSKRREEIIKNRGGSTHY